MDVEGESKDVEWQMDWSMAIPGHGTDQLASY